MNTSFINQLRLVLEQTNQNTYQNNNAPSTQQVPNGLYSPTVTWHGDVDSTNKELVDAYHTIQALRAQKLENMSVDQKIELALTRSLQAENAVYQALRRISSFEQQLENVLKGNQAKTPVSDSDPESIF